MNRKAVWITVAVFLLAYESLLQLVPSSAWGHISDPHWKYLFKAACVIGLGAIAYRFIFEKRRLLKELNPKGLFLDPPTFASLRFSIPVLLSWIPAILFSTPKTILSDEWKVYLTSNFFLSSLSEEVIFRGVIFRIFEYAFPFNCAALWTSVIFGGVHLNRLFSAVTIGQASFALLRIAVAATNGYYLSVLYKHCRYNLWAPIMYHFLINGIGLFSASEEFVGLAFSLVGISASWMWIHMALVRNNNTVFTELTTSSLSGR